MAISAVRLVNLKQGIEAMLGFVKVDRRFETLKFIRSILFIFSIKKSIRKKIPLFFYNITLRTFGTILSLALY